MSESTPHPALQHLQITFKSSEYQTIIRKHTRILFRPSEAGTSYWQRLPNYLIARCPFCGATYTGLLDTHSLHGGWSTHPDIYKSVYLGKYQHIGCGHFVAVQTFVNMNGLLPTEMTYYSNYLDVPFVMATLVPDDIPSVAVMHSLPICRIEHNAFVPRYAAYMITYYAIDATILWERRRIQNETFGADDLEYDGGSVMYTSGEASLQPETWDLPLWVAQGKLQWLDPSSSDLPLKAGPPEELPYVDIQGYRRPFTARNGKLHLH
jgi:hypothetical protein